FFVYGGLLFPIEHLSTLSREIQTIRDEFGYRDGDVLKFDTNARPHHVPVEAATEAKRRVVQLCRDLRCKFIVCVILHDIIKKQNPDNQVLWAANHVIGRFNLYLQQIDDDGIVVVDKLPVNADFQYLAEKHSTGLTFEDGTTVKLDRIKLYA